MSRHNHRQQGFTVIELTLAMAFLAFILIFTTITTIQMMRTYNKGVTIKQINQAGRTLIEDLSRSLSAGSAADIDTTFIPQGRLCVGKTVYIWNPVYTPSKTYNPVIWTKFNNKPATLIRSDRTSVTCSNSPALNLMPTTDRFALLSDQARVLGVDVQQNSDKKLVTLTFMIGTYDSSEEPALGASPMNTGGLYITPYYSSGNLTCRPGSEGNFCSFSSFKTTVYVGN